MTPKQKKVLEFIAAFQERMGYQPSQTEIARGCGFESLGTVQHYLRVLEREGHISRRWNAKRGVQLRASASSGNVAKGGTLSPASQEGDLWPLRHEASVVAEAPVTYDMEPEGLGSKLALELPLVGIVAAGRPVEAFQISEHIEVPSAMAADGNVVYEVRGDSMVEMGIMDGDFVAVHPQEVAENGQTVIAEVNGSITIKRYRRKGKSIELHPANAAMQPIIVTEEDDFHIRGVLVGSMRFYKKWSGKSFT